MPIPVFSSTKSRFLCFFCLRDPRFRASRAQNRHFCALFAFGTPIFRLFEHKIGIFVRFCQQVSSRWVIRLPPGRGIAAGWQMMLPAESGTLPHRPWATMPLVNGRTRKRSAAGGWSEAEVCAEELAAPRKPMRLDCIVEEVAAALAGVRAGLPFFLSGHLWSLHPS